MKTAVRTGSRAAARPPWPMARVRRRSSSFSFCPWLMAAGCAADPALPLARFPARENRSEPFYRSKEKMKEPRFSAALYSSSFGLGAVIWGGIGNGRRRTDPGGAGTAGRAGDPRRDFPPRKCLGSQTASLNACSPLSRQPQSLGRPIRCLSSWLGRRQILGFSCPLARPVTQEAHLAPARHLTHRCRVPLSCCCRGRAFESSALLLRTAQAHR